MKKIGISSFFAILCFGLAGFVSAVVQIHTNNYSQVILGDVYIIRNGNSWQCDRVYCPIATEQCLVTKTISPKNSTIVIRKNLCITVDNRKLIEETFTEKARPSKSNELAVICTRSGISYVTQSIPSDNYTQSSFESIVKHVDEKLENVQLDKNLRDAQREIAKAERDITKAGTEV